MYRYTQDVVEQAISNLPRNMTTQPTPLTTAYLMGFDQTISKPSFAEEQKFFPLSAIRIQAFLLINCTILSTQARQHRIQSTQQFTHLLAAFSPPLLAFSIWLLIVSTIISRNCTTDNSIDPKAKLPKWYLKALPQLLSTGKCSSSPGPWEKYHIQQALAITNIVMAWTTALHHSVANTKQQKRARARSAYDQIEVKTSLSAMNFAALTRYTMHSAHNAHKPAVTRAMITGTITTEQTSATNLPADLQTATASLILLHRQMKIMRSSPASPHIPNPQYLIYCMSAPILGMLNPMYWKFVSPNRPPEQQNMKPSKMIDTKRETMEVHTTQPTHHRSSSINTKLTTIAKTTPMSSTGQL